MTHVWPNDQTAPMQKGAKKQLLTHFKKNAAGITEAFPKFSLLRDYTTMRNGLSDNFMHF